jgi:hypothetical protein
MFIHEKIDIVYLWVDGNDPVWRQKRQNSLHQLNANNRNSIAKYGNVEGRFRDNDELRYSLRALERYFPDCGHVYIVTDAQRPAWLQNSAHISIIDHTDRTFAHSPRPMLKSMLFALETEAADLFESVRSTVFRAWDKPTIVSDFVLRWALANYQARVGDYSHIYLSTGDIKSNADLESFIAADGLLDFFCINDTTDDADNLDPRLTMVQAALQTMFPIASRYELPVNDAATAAITSAYIASGNKPA